MNTNPASDADAPSPDEMVAGLRTSGRAGLTLVAAGLGLLWVIGALVRRQQRSTDTSPRQPS